MTVAFTEEQGSPTEVLTTTQFKAQRELRCAWADRITLMQELIGTAYPGWATALCVGCTQKPVDGKNMGTGDASAYEFAIIIANYESPVWSGLLNDSYTENIEPFSQFLTIDPETFCFASAIVGDLPKGESAGLLLNGCVYIHTKFNRTTVPAVQDYLDHVNSVVITPKKNDLARNWSFAVGTLLFCTPTIEEIQNRSGHWRLTYKCKHRPQGWNKVLNPITGALETMKRCKRDDTGAITEIYDETYTPYPSANFSSLFNV